VLKEKQQMGQAKQTQISSKCDANLSFSPLLASSEFNTSLNKSWQLQYYNQKILDLIETFSSYGQPQLMAKNAC
jgi:hypothetical protein